MSRRTVVLTVVILILFSLGCTSVGRLVVAPTPTATPTMLPTLLPTDTVTPTPTITPTPTWTPTLVPTATATGIATETPTPTITTTPEALALVTRPSVNVRSGPGTAYSWIGEVRQGESYSIVGTNEAGTWWLICCIDNGIRGWVRADLLEISGPLDAIEIVSVPTPTPQPTATDTPIPPTPTHGLAFYRGLGPVFMPTNNEWITLWVRVYGGIGDGYPIPGWRLEIKRNGIVLEQSEPSGTTYNFSAPPDDDFGNRVKYNLKHEIYNPGEARWEVYLVDAGGVPRSPVVEFTTQNSNPRREIFIGFLSAQ